MKAATAMVAALLLSLLPSAAYAEEVPVEIVFDQPNLTVEYGQYWSFPFIANWWVYAFKDHPEVTFPTTGLPEGYAPVYSFWQDLSTPQAHGTVTRDENVEPLRPGSYTFAIKADIDGGIGFEGKRYVGETTPPAQLTVTPAKLGIELRVVPDPSNGDALITTARFTGRFVEEYVPYDNAARSPGGAWSIAFVDGAGETVLERSIERAEGDDILSTSFYWADAKPGEQYTATAQFTATGASVSSFEITPTEFDFTAPVEQRPTPSSSATATPDADLASSSDFGLPAWVLVIMVALLLALAALATLLGIRLYRRRAITPMPKEEDL